MQEPGSSGPLTVGTCDSQLSTIKWRPSAEGIHSVGCSRKICQWVKAFASSMLTQGMEERINAFKLFPHACTHNKWINAVCVHVHEWLFVHTHTHTKLSHEDFQPKTSIKYEFKTEVFHTYQETNSPLCGEWADLINEHGTYEGTDFYKCWSHQTEYL